MLAFRPDEYKAQQGAITYLKALGINTTQAIKLYALKDEYQKKDHGKWGNNT